MAKRSETQSLPPTYGALLRSWRIAAGLSQDELAHRMRASVSTICLAENGERRMSYDMGMAAFSALRVPPWLLTFLEYFHQKVELGFASRHEQGGFSSGLLDLQSKIDQLEADIARQVCELFSTLSDLEYEQESKARQTRSQRRKAIVEELLSQGEGAGQSAGAPKGRASSKRRKRRQ